VPKTVTLRLDNDVYDMIKRAAEADRRSISNYIEVAAMSHLLHDIFVSDDEMDEILSDSDLVKSLRRGMREIREGKVRFID